MKIKIKNIFLIVFVFDFLYLINSKELFEEYYEKAEEILNNMTRNEKIGQIFLPRYNVLTADDEIKKYSPAGFVLFGNNIINHTKEELIKELDERREKSKIPLVFGVDEEGGTVCRVSLYFRENPFLSPQELFTAGGFKEILSIEQEKRDLLRELTLNYNFAPVADISLNESDYMYDRSLGQDVETTSNYINKVVDSYYNDNFTCCLKHFPGYGNNTNTHDDVSHDYRPIDYLKKNDLVPFINAIGHKVPMIMVSHNIIMDIDNEYPSSLSKKIHDILRKDNNYTGLIVTDSLSMGAITKYTKNISASVLAVLAGNDLIVTSTFEEHIDSLIKAVDNNEVNMSLIETAAKRVIAWKLKYIYPHDNPRSLNSIFLYFLGVVVIIGVIILIVCIIMRKKYKNEFKNSDDEQNNENDTNEKRLISNNSEQRESEN
jgi:beta-N-acetylhexosaminidase